MLSLKCLEAEITCGVCTAKRERSSRHFLCMGYSFTFCKPVSQVSINGQVNKRPVHAGLQSAHGFTMRPAHRKHVLCPLAHVIASSPSSRIASMHTGQGSAGAAIWPVRAKAFRPAHRV